MTAASVPRDRNGFARLDITVAGGKTGEEKVAILRERVQRSRWVRWGRRMGFASAARVLELANRNAD